MAAEQSGIIAERLKAAGKEGVKLAKQLQRTEKSLILNLHKGEPPWLSRLQIKLKSRLNRC